MCVCVTRINVINFKCVCVWKVDENQDWFYDLFGVDSFIFFCEFSLLMG